jgi:hypothetical protein
MKLTTAFGRQKGIKRIVIISFAHAGDFCPYKIPDE